MAGGWYITRLELLGAARVLGDARVTKQGVQRDREAVVHEMPQGVYALRSMRFTSSLHYDFLYRNVYLDARTGSRRRTPL